MRFNVLIVVILILLALGCIFRRHLFESFSATYPLKLSWTPSGPTPQNIAYNWGLCISSGGDNVPTGQCTTQNPAYPPGPPGPGWDYHGQTPQGQASLVLNNTNSLYANFGQTLTLLLQAVDMVNPTHPTSEWTEFTLDLASKATVIKNTITDSTVQTQTLYPGSVGFVYTLQLNQPGFASGNIASIKPTVVRGSQVFAYNTHVPFANISSDNTSASYTGSVTSGTLWSPSAPGALQVGDILYVESRVIAPGSSGTDGTVYYAGTFSQTVASITPSAPTGVVWNIS